MKTISVAFVAGLSLMALAALSGCNKKGGESASGPSCDATVTKMMGMSGDEMFGQMAKEKQDKWKTKFTELMVTACKEDKWSPDVLKCAHDAADKKAMDECGDKLGKPEQEKMMKRMEPFMKEMMEDMGMGAAKPPEAAAPAPEGAPAAGGEASGIAECDAYMATFDKYMACDKVPQQAKDASKQGVDAMKQGWAMLKDPNVPAESKKAAADACKAGEDALKQSATALGCTL
jgi:hypothetical protein